MESDTTSSEKSAVSVFAVIVLYKCTMRASASFRTLQEAIMRVPGEKLRIGILLYDNGPDPEDPGVLPEDVIYERSLENRGLSAAYNRAIEIAQRESFQWLLTLDQDTSLPAEFLEKLSETARRVESSPEIAAIVPLIFENGRQLSPEYFLFNAIPRYIPKEFVGVFPQKTFAFNSASTLR